MVEKKEPFDEKCRRLGLFDKSLEDIIDMIAGKNKEIERMSGQFAKGFAAGMDCTLRRNPLYMNSPGDDVRSEAEVRRASDREAAQERRGAMGV